MCAVVGEGSTGTESAAQTVGGDKTDDGEDGNFTMINRYRSDNRA